MTKELRSHIPEDGSTISNRVLQAKLGWDEETYTTVRDRLVKGGGIILGGGPGGTVRLAEGASKPAHQANGDDDPRPVPYSPNPTKPKVFIGSSKEGLKIAEAIQYGLHRVAECTIWHQGVFGLSWNTLDSLIRQAKSSNWAVLILTADDLVTKRAKIGKTPRDNVIFELGLFIGALGRERTFMVHNHDTPPELPSDLAGVTAATYGNRSDGNLEAELGPACVQLKKAMNI